MSDKNEYTIETAIDIETKSGSFDHTQPNNEKKIVQITAMKSDCPTQSHNGKNIDKIIVSQYIEDISSYVVTYSKEDNSILGWNIEKEGEQQPDGEDFKLGKPYDIRSFVLYKRLLLFRYYGYYDSNKSEVGK